MQTIAISQQNKMGILSLVVNLTSSQSYPLLPSILPAFVAPRNYYGAHAIDHHFMGAIWLGYHLRDRLNSYPMASI